MKWIYLAQQGSMSSTFESGSEHWGAHKSLGQSSGVQICLFVYCLHDDVSTSEYITSAV